MSINHWKINSLSFPKGCLNFIFTNNTCNLDHLKEMVECLKKGIAEVQKNPHKFKSQNESLYGVGVNIPNIVMSEAMLSVVDVLNDLPNDKIVVIKEDEQEEV